MDVPGEKLLIRLWETLDGAACGLLNPWQIRRVGRARNAVLREERLILAQAERDAEDIRAGRKSLAADGELVEFVSHGTQDTSRKEASITGLAATAQRNLLSREMRREVNVGKAVLHAQAELEDDAREPPSGRVGEDWISRWRDSASQVSDEELQTLWGRVLAGEIKSPGTFSLRTLEFLKNLSKQDAEEIAKLAPFVVEGSLFLTTQSIWESVGITLGFLLRLHDLGLVEVTPDARGVTRTFASSQKDRFELGLVAFNRGLMVTDQDADKTLSLQARRLTSVGKEVLKLGHFLPNEPALRQLGQTIRSYGFKVFLTRYQPVTTIYGIHREDEEL